MTPALMFFIELLWLGLFGWYFATDYGARKRILAFVLVAVAVAMSVMMIYPPDKKIALGLDIKGGTSFLIRLQQTDKEITPAMLDQAVEVIRKRVDYFGASEPIISPVGKDRILVQIPGLSTEKIQEARQQLSRVAKLEFKLVYPDNGERLRAIDAGTEVIPPEYKIETYTPHAEENKKPQQERLLVKKKADLGGERVSGSNAYYGNEGWGVQLRFDSEGAKQFGNITEKSKGYRFAIVLDGQIQSAPVIRDAIYGGDAQITGRFSEQEARQLASVLENPLQTPVSIEEERSVSPTLGLDSIRDIQVLCPMNRGGIGARSLNIELQAALNPAGERRVERFGWTFAPGDKVMQIENDYDKEVYNGDIGYIDNVDPNAGEIVASFDVGPLPTDLGNSTCWCRPMPRPFTRVRAQNTPPWSSRS